MSENVVRSAENRGEKGFVLVVVAGLLVVLLGFAALGVSVGYLYSARTTAQEIGDSAALAGAFTYITNPAEANPGGYAETHATEVALGRAAILGVPLAPEDVTATANVAGRRVQVDIRTVQPTFFAALLGPGAAAVATTSIAEAGSPSDVTGATCAVPWFIPNHVLDPNPNSPPGFCGDCANGTDLLVHPATGEPTSFALANLGASINLSPATPQGAIAPGQFYNIRLGPGQSGANDIRQNISGCFNQPVECFDEYQVEPGRMVGPIQQGVNQRIGTPNQDRWLGVGSYEAAGGGISNTSRSLAIAPIWDTCSMSSYCASGNFPSGANVRLRIAGFALVFIEGMQGTVVRSRLVNATGCTAFSGGGDGEDGAPAVGSPAFSLPLRLVRVPDAG